jgi:hypothetical protein
LTGGEALQVSTTAAQRAAEEARSGKWLEELESGGLLRALAPGMERGAFGAWALDGAEGQDLLILPIKEGFQVIYLVKQTGRSGAFKHTSPMSQQLSDDANQIVSMLHSHVQIDILLKQAGYAGSKQAAHLQNERS